MARRPRRNYAEDLRRAQSGGLTGQVETLVTQVSSLGSTSLPTKRAMLSFAAPAIAAIPTRLKNAELFWRVPYALDAAPTRLRLRVRNYDILAKTALTTGANFLDVYIGEQALDANGVGTGGYRAAPTRAFPAFTLPADGSEYVSAWVSDPTVIAALAGLVGKKLMWSFAYTGGDNAAGQNIGQATGPCGCYVDVTSGHSANVGQQAATGLSAGLFPTTPFDIRVEYEFQGNQQVVMVLSDSIAVYAGTTTAIEPFLRWPETHNRRQSTAILVNGGVGSGTLTAWATASDWIVQRLNPSEIAYDAALITLGVNDFANGAPSLATVKTRLASVVSMLAGLTNPIAKLYGMRLTPNPSTWRATLHTLARVGVTSIVTRQTIPNGAAIRLGGGNQAESFTLAAAPTDNGDGTFTITLPTATTKVHFPGEPISISVQEANRADYNDYLASLPFGMRAVGFPDLAVTPPWDTQNWHPQITTDNLHPLPAGHQIYASTVPPIR